MESFTKLLTVSDVANRLSLSEYQVREHLKYGKIKGIKVVGVWRVSEEAMQEFLKECEVNAYASPDSNA
jgi:excisionase family DNA binding protein